MALLGIQQEKQLEKSIEFWDCHQTAIEWWLQIQDLLRYQQQVCLGLDVVAVKADAEMRELEYTKEDYLQLRLIAKTVTEIFNESITHE